jgi:hypothetical protein
VKRVPPIALIYAIYWFTHHSDTQYFTICGRPHALCQPSTTMPAGRLRPPRPRHATPQSLKPHPAACSGPVRVASPLAAGGAQITQIWVADLGRRFGSQIWVADLGRRFEALDSTGDQRMRVRGGQPCHFKQARHTSEGNCNYFVLWRGVL